MVISSVKGVREFEVERLVVKDPIPLSIIAHSLSWADPPHPLLPCFYTHHQIHQRRVAREPEHRDTHVLYLYLWGFLNELDGLDECGV